MPYVVVQQDGAAQSVAEWRMLPPHVPDFEQREALRWNEVCGELVNRAVGMNTTSMFNVFLFFDRIELLEERNRPALAALIRRARERCWGARLLLTLSKAPPLSRIPTADRADIAAWMKEVAAGKVSEVVQTHASLESTTADGLRNILRNHASAATERHEILQGTSGHRPWRCALPANWLDTAHFLGPELATTRAEGQGAYDLVILLQGSTREEQAAEIDRHLLKDPARRRRYRVVTYMHAPDRLQELQELCQEREIGRPIAMGGDFELWFLMLRLNEQARTRWDDAESIHPVPPAASPRLKISNDESPVLLLTSTFDPREKLQWLEAATDVGQFLHQSTAGFECRVELAVDTQRLIQILNQTPVAAWVHMGHGSGVDGLWTPKGGHIAPALWADCFRNKELRLAMFLTCDSHEIAHFFAEQGAGVAIGFEGKVESDKTRELARGILAAMLTDGARAGRILAGFLSGEAWFTATQCLTASPRAYYPRRV